MNRSISAIQSEYVSRSVSRKMKLGNEIDCNNYRIVSKHDYFLF